MNPVCEYMSIYVQPKRFMRFMRSKVHIHNPLERNLGHHSRTKPMSGLSKCLAVLEAAKFEYFSL
jgi:hypothetical protein